MPFDYTLSAEVFEIDDTHLETVGVFQSLTNDLTVCVLHRPAHWDVNYSDDNHVLYPSRPRIFVIKRASGVWGTPLEIETDSNFWIHPDYVEFGGSFYGDTAVTYRSQGANGFLQDRPYFRSIDVGCTVVSVRSTVPNIDATQYWSMPRLFTEQSASFAIVGKTIDPGPVNWSVVPVVNVGSSGGLFMTSGSYKYYITAVVGSEETTISQPVTISNIPSTKTVTVTWQRKDYVDGYNIYRIWSDAPITVVKVTSIANPYTTSYIDNGSTHTITVLPPASNLGNSLSLCVVTGGFFSYSVLKSFVSTDIITTSRFSAAQDYLGVWHIVGDVRQSTGPYRPFYVNTSGETKYLTASANFDGIDFNGNRFNKPLRPMMVLDRGTPGQAHIVYTPHVFMAEASTEVYYIKKTGINLWSTEKRISDGNLKRATAHDIFMDGEYGFVHVLLADDTLANNTTLDILTPGIAYVKIEAATESVDAAVSVFRTASATVKFERSVFSKPISSRPFALILYCWANFWDGTAITGDVSGTKRARVYWNSNDLGVSTTVVNTFGTALDIARPTGASYYRVEIGQNTICGGGPLVSGDTYVQAITPPGTLFIDKSCPVTATGQITTFTMSQVNSGATFPLVPGDIKLVIQKPNEEIRGVVDMDVAQGVPGMFRYSGTINAESGDYVGVWIKHGKGIRIGASSETEGQTNMIQYDAVDGMVPDLVLAGLGVNTSPAKVLNVVCRGDIRTGIFLNSGYYSDGTNEDAYGYQIFSYGTNAFYDGNVTNGSNLFDTDASTTASTASGLNGNVYYNMDAITDLVPIESVAVNCPTIAANAKVEIYGSIDTTRAKSLAGAQAVVNWRLMATVSVNSIAASNWIVPIGQKVKWVRLKLIGGSSQPVQIGAFKIKAMTATVSNSHLPVNPAGGWTRDRVFFDGASNRLCPQITATVASGSIVPSDNVVILNATPAEFYSQIVPGDALWAYRRVRNSNMKYYANTLLNINQGFSSLGFSSGFGGSIVAGGGEVVSVAPPMIAYRVTAFNSAGSVIDSTDWIPVIGTINTALRTHAVFTSGA